MASLSDYKYSILILIFGLIYFQFFMDHHSNPHHKFEISSDTIIFHANWTKSLSDMCCYSKFHSALQLNGIKNLDISFSMSGFNDTQVQELLNKNVQQFKIYDNIKLELSGCKLTNQGIINVLRKITNGVKSLELNINGIKTTQGFGVLLANQLNRLTTLQELKISLIMSISDFQVDKFIEKHKPSKSLLSLQLILIGNQITKLGIAHTKSYLSQLQNLNNLSFNLYANKLGFEGAQILSEALKQRLDLQTLNLDLYFNNITQIGTQNISAVIQNMQNLKSLTLNLDFNYIKNQGGKALGKSLSKMTKLQNLYLGVASKNFGYLGFKYVINGIQKLTQLKRLSLRCGVNRVGYNGAEITQQMLAKLTKLEYLELGFIQNYVGDDGITLLSQQVAKMTSLKQIHLNFAFNDAKSFGLIKTIKAFLNSKYQTFHLSLSSNEFRDSQVKLIQNYLTTLIKNNDKFILDFTDTAISKKQMAKLEQTFKDANINFGKNSKLSVNSIIPEQQPAKSAPIKNQSKTASKVQTKNSQKVQNKTQNKNEKSEL